MFAIQEYCELGNTNKVCSLLNVNVKDILNVVNRGLVVCDDSDDDDHRSGDL